MSSFAGDTGPSTVAGRKVLGGKGGLRVVGDGGFEGN